MTLHQHSLRRAALPEICVCVVAWRVSPVPNNRYPNCPLFHLLVKDERTGFIHYESQNCLQTGQPRNREEDWKHLVWYHRSLAAMVNNLRYFFLQGMSQRIACPHWQEEGGWGPRWWCLLILNRLSVSQQPAYQLAWNGEHPNKPCWYCMQGRTHSHTAFLLTCPKEFCRICSGNSSRRHPESLMVKAELDQVKRENWRAVFERAGGMLSKWARVRNVSNSLSRSPAVATAGAF